MSSDAIQAALAFVSADGEGGFVLKVSAANTPQIEFPLDLKRAARLQMQLAEAIGVLAGAKPEPAMSNDKYFQR